MTMAVPTVDLDADRAAVAQQIDDACRDVGFFQIVGHGIDAGVADAAWDAAHEFFALPLDDKLSVAIPEGDAYGYGPFQIERLAASLGDTTPPDLKETFSVGPFEPAPPDLTDPAAAFVYSPNRWPASLPTMAPAFGAYYDAMASLVSRVMSPMAVALGLDDDWFDRYIDRHTSALRALHYPDLTGQRVEAGQLRAGAHTDYGTLTLLRQDDAPGGGTTTRWSVLRQRSFVHRCRASPTLTTNAPGTAGTSTHSPSAPRNCSPPGASSCRSSVSVP